MKAEFGLVYNLWTELLGAGEFLDEAVGNITLDGLTVPVITGPQRQYRPRRIDDQPAFGSTGGWHYPTGTDHYRGGPLRPRSSRWFGKRDVLAKVRDFAAAHKLKTCLRVDLRTAGGQLDQEPHLCARDAFGRESQFAAACPLNANLRELVRDIVADLSRYEPASIELVAFLPDQPRDLETHPLRWNPLLRELADCCFCPACREVAAAADVDPEHVAASVQDYLRRLLDDPTDEAATAAALADDGLRAYRDARFGEHRTWLERLDDAHAALQFRMQRPQPGPNREEVITLPRGWVKMQSLLAASELEEPNQVASPGVGLIVPVWHPQVPEASELVSHVRGYAAAGTALIDFEGLDLAPPAAVEWVRQAVRFAHRE